jgi:hypothetical protein
VLRAIICQQETGHAGSQAKDYVNGRLVGLALRKIWMMSPTAEADGQIPGAHSGGPSGQLRAVVASLGIVIALAGCGSGQKSATTKTTSDAAAHSRATTPTPSQRAPGSSNVATEVTAYLFPRSGADWADGMQVHNFELAQEEKATTACLVANGFPAAPTPLFPPYKYGTAELPNLPMIQRTLAIGVTVALRTPKNPVQGMSKSEAAAYTAELAKCSAKTGSELAFLSKGSTLALVDEWKNITDATVATKPVAALNNKATSCASATPFAATSVVGEMDKIAGKVTPLVIKLQAQAARATEKAGARVLIRCFGPEINLLSSLLAKRRTVFFSQNAQAIDQIASEANRAATTLTGRVRKKASA